MLMDNLSGPSEADLVKRISAIRNPSEPEAPTEEKKEAVEVSDLDTAEEVEVEAQAPQEEEVVEAADSEQLEVEEGESLEASEEETETLYLDLDGDEVSLDTIREWKDGNLRHSDYTRKTMDLAEQRKAVEAEQANLSETQSKMTDLIAELEAQIEVSGQDINWEELREYDPSEYLKQKELLEKRQEALNKAKGLSGEVKGKASQEQINAEQAKLLQANPSWMDKSGNTTEQYSKDMQMVNEYLNKEGYQPDEINNILSAHHWQTILKAARYDSQSEKASVMTKKVKKAPVVTKPKSQARSNLDRQIAAAQAKFKKTGDMRDAQALMKLKRQKGN